MRRASSRLLRGVQVSGALTVAARSSARWNRSPRSSAAISTLSSTPWIDARCAFDMSSGAKRYTAGENRWKWRESVAAIITYGTAATPGCDAVSGIGDQRELGVVGRRFGRRLARFDDLDAHERVADAAPHAPDGPRDGLAERDAQVERRGCLRRQHVRRRPAGLHRRGHRRAHERGRLAAESRRRPARSAAGAAASRRSRCRAGPGVCAANCDSIRVIAFGVCGRNVPRVEPVERARDAPDRGQLRGSGGVAALAARRQAEGEHALLADADHRRVARGRTAAASRRPRRPRRARARARCPASGRIAAIACAAAP